MRIITFLLSSFLIMAILGGVGFLGLREGLLFWGSLKVEQALSDLKYINKNQAVYVQQCKSKGNTSETNVISQLRLRFTSPQAFVTEVVCDQFPNDPIAVKQDTLPPFVTKVAGFSGVIWGDNPSGVVLQIWGRQTNIGVISQVVQSSAAFQLGQPQPQTSCTGYSQLCCEDETEQGVGQVNDQATDCPQSCYTSCLARPVILSFTSDPFYDQATRTVTIPLGSSITFAFVSSSADASPPLMTISYGDNQQDTATGVTGQFDHVYECNSGTCRYTATISAQDNSGIQSAVTSLARITVVVQ